MNANPTILLRNLQQTTWGAPGASPTRYPRPQTDNGPAYPATNQPSGISELSDWAKFAFTVVFTHFLLYRPKALRKHCERLLASDEAGRNNLAYLRKEIRRAASDALFFVFMGTFWIIGNSFFMYYSKGQVPTPLLNDYIVQILLLVELTKAVSDTLMIYWYRHDIEERFATAQAEQEQHPHAD